MSNQVFAGPDNRFIDFPANNIYYTAADLAIPAGATDTIVFADESSTPIPVKKLERLGSLFRANQAGQYSVNAVIAFQSSAPTSVDIDVNLFLESIYDSTTRLLTQQIIRIPARGGSSGADQRVLTLSWVGFMSAGTEFRVRCKNEEATDLSVLDGSALYITKIS